jgi:cytochrome c oxidase subunit IV
LIIAVFMHMRWDAHPDVCHLVRAIARDAGEPDVMESAYTFWTRIVLGFKLLSAGNGLSLCVFSK